MTERKPESKAKAQERKALAQEVMTESQLLHDLARKALAQAKQHVALLQACCDRRAGAFHELQGAVAVDYYHGAELAIRVGDLLQTHDDWASAGREYDEAMNGVDDAEQCGGK